MKRLYTPLNIVALLMFAAAPFMIARAPYESTMGLVQKIFYFHVPSALTAFLSAFVSGIASAIFLFRRTQRADRVALAAAELVVVFGLLTLVTGPLWARKAWGVWWQWDAKLTSMLVLWMIFVAYLLLRRFGGPGSEPLSAGMALFGMVNVPFVYWSAHLWRTVHPKTTVVPTLQGGMRTSFYFCLIAFLLLYLLMLTLRTRLEAARAQLEEVYREID